MMQSIIQIPTNPNPIPTMPQSHAPSIELILLITTLLIQFRQTLKTSTDFLEQLDTLIDSINDLFRTLFRRK
jgi:hypothetical protein